MCGRKKVATPHSVQASAAALGLVGEMVGPSKNSAEGNRLLKAVVLDLNNNQWGWEEVKKKQKKQEVVQSDSE